MTTLTNIAESIRVERNEFIFREIFKISNTEIKERLKKEVLSCLDSSISIYDAIAFDMGSLIKGINKEFLIDLSFTGRYLVNLLLIHDFIIDENTIDPDILHLSCAIQNMFYKKNSYHGNMLSYDQIDRYLEATRISRNSEKANPYIGKKIEECVEIYKSRSIEKAIFFNLLFNILIKKTEDPYEISILQEYQKMGHYMIYSTQYLDDIQDLKEDISRGRVSELIMLGDGLNIEIGIRILASIGLTLGNAINLGFKESKALENTYLYKSASENSLLAKKRIAVITEYHRKLSTIENLHHLSNFDKAIAFFKQSTNDNFLFVDFTTSAGYSDLWVSGFICHNLSYIDHIEIIDILKKCEKTLSELQNPDGGWGYNRLVCSDSDSTAWIATFLAKTNMQGNSNILAKAEKYLSDHYQKDGYSTYNESEANFISEQMGLKSDDFRGWTQAHSCVTLSVELFKKTYGSKSVSKFIFPKKPSYWWESDAYNFHLLAVLKPESILIDSINKVINMQDKDGCWFEKDSQNPDIFATSLYIIGLKNILASENSNKSEAMRISIEEGVKYLNHSQLADGSWKNSALMRVPYPHDISPEKTYHKKCLYGLGITTTDILRVFTSSVAFRAIYGSI